MQQRYINFIFTIFIIFNSNISIAESISNKVQDVVKFIWTAEDAQYQECLTEISKISTENYTNLVIAIYEYPRANYEGSSMLMGMVTGEFMKRMDIKDVKAEMLNMLKSNNSPLDLKIHILQGISGWAEDDTIAVCNELDEISTPDSELWFYVQRGISRLVSSRYYKAKRQSQKDITDHLSKFSKEKVKSIMSDLLVYEPGDKMYGRCIGKTIGAYTGTAPLATEQSLVESLSEKNISTSKQLEILDGMYGWRNTSAVVTDHVNALKAKAVKDKKPLTAKDEKRAKNLLKHHEDQ